MVRATVMGTEGEVPIGEQLWAATRGTNQAEICCIPFVVRNMNLGDLVEIKDFLVKAVLRASGNRTLRVYVPKPLSNPEAGPVGDVIRNYSLEYEASPVGLLALNVRPSHPLGDIRAELQDLEEQGIIEYETGWD